MSDEVEIPEVAVEDESHPVPDSIYFKANAIVAGAVGVLSIYLIVTGVGYGAWDGEKPGPGFFPICVGLALLALAVIWLLQSLRRRVIREEDSSLPDRRGLINILVSVAIVIAFGLVVSLVGFAIPFALALGVLFRVVAKRKWLFTAIASVATTAIVAVLFRLALGVPLPLSPVPFLSAIGI